MYDERIEGIKKYDRLFLPLSSVFLLSILYLRRTASVVYASNRYQQLY